MTVTYHLYGGPCDGVTHTHESRGDDEPSFRTLVVPYYTLDVESGLPRFVLLLYERDPAHLRRLTYKQTKSWGEHRADTIRPFEDAFLEDDGEEWKRGR